MADHALLIYPPHVAYIGDKAVCLRRTLTFQLCLLIKLFYWTFWILFSSA